MPEKETMRRAREDQRKGKAPSTQAGEFVREEVHHIREGKHGAKNAKQAIAIGLSKARRAGVKIGARKGASAGARRKAAKESARSESPQPPDPKRSRATSKTLKTEPRRAAKKTALAAQARRAAKARGPASRSRAAKKGARTRRKEATT